MGSSWNVGRQHGASAKSVHLQRTVGIILGGKKRVPDGHSSPLYRTLVLRPAVLKRDLTHIGLLTIGPWS